MTRTLAAAASQDALNTILCDALPCQGDWSDDLYLWLTERTNRLIELTDGHVEVLPMPTATHQIVLAALYDLFKPYVRARSGIVLFSGLRMRVRDGKFRDSDLLVLRDRSDPRNQDRFWLGADLVVEVVGPDDPNRDLVVKRIDYAEAEVPEYWIVDPRFETITVLALAGGRYAEHGVFARGDTATSPLLDGFEVDVATVFDEAGEERSTPRKRPPPAGPGTVRTPEGR